MLATSSTNSVVDPDAVLPAVTDRRAQLELILAITQKMLQMAEQPQWELVGKLEAERSHLISSFFETKPTVDEAEHVASVILEVLKNKKKITALSAIEQRHILANSQKMHLGKRAAQAYSISNK